VTKGRVTYWRFKRSCCFDHQGRRLLIKPDWWGSRFIYISVSQNFLVVPSPRRSS